MVIMFSAIVSLTSSIKTLNIFAIKKDKYVWEYATYLNLTSLLANKKLDMNKGGRFSGTMNNMKYKIECIPYQSKRTFSYSEMKDSNGNFGSFNIVLFKCTLMLNYKNKSDKKNIFISRDYKVETNEFK